MSETSHTTDDTLDKLSNTFVLTPQEFVTVALLDLRGGFGPAGLRRMMNIWEAADCDKVLIGLHNKGVIQKKQNGQPGYVVTAETRTHLRSAFSIAVPIPPESLSQPRVTAECHDECVYEVPSFDCTGWFERASDEQIRDLIDTGFGGGQASEVVAEHYDGVIDAVTVMFAYKRRGFECHVDAGEAWAWIKVHRPYLHQEYESGQNVIRGTGS